MAIRKITEYPEKVLGEVGKAVEKFDEELAELCADMFETMYDAEGVGLAAPQIGLNLRLFVMDCEGIKLIAANPEIIETSRRTIRSGRLSVGRQSSGSRRPPDESETKSAKRKRRMVRARSRRLRRPRFSARNRSLRRQTFYRSPAENAPRYGR